ncbi:MAG TPA: hypothetical protein PK916_04825 [Bacteroidota bacterium]|nr:hypothetical protein [Bacteroidota bacterium]
MLLCVEVFRLSSENGQWRWPHWFLAAFERTLGFIAAGLAETEFTAPAIERHLREDAEDLLSGCSEW